MKYTVKAHPQAKLTSSLYKWGVFAGKELVEGTRTKERAQHIADELNSYVPTKNGRDNDRV